MDINLTLFGEMLTFAILVWVMARYIWPSLMKVIETRQQQISEGLAAYERGKQNLAMVQAKIAKKLREAKDQAAEIVQQATHKSDSYIEEAKITAQTERTKILSQAQLEIEQELQKAKDELQSQMAELAIEAAEKILRQKFDQHAQKKLLDELIADL